MTAPMDDTRMADLEQLAAAATPGPWKECGHDRGGCNCCFIWSKTADSPIATATHGDWGDDYPTLKVTGGSLDRSVSAVMEQITYGRVEPAQGQANAAYIAAAGPDTITALITRLKAAETALDQLDLAHTETICDLTAARSENEALRKALADLLPIAERNERGVETQAARLLLSKDADHG